MPFFDIRKQLSATEQEGFAALYEANKNLLTNIVLKHFNDREIAEDAVSETFLAAIKNKEKILSKTPTDFRKWAVVTVKNKCRDIIKREKKAGRQVSLDEPEASELVSDDEPLDLYVIRQETAARLAECLDELDYDNRLIFELKYNEGMANEKIARQMGLTDAQVKGRLERARAKLKQSLTKRGVDRNG